MNFDLAQLAPAVRIETNQINNSRSLGLMFHFSQNVTGVSREYQNIPTAYTISDLAWKRYPDGSGSNFL